MTGSDELMASEKTASLVEGAWLPTGLRFARYRFAFEATTFLDLPDYKGSSFRGAFGRALKLLTCAQRGREQCPGCMLTGVCAYTRLFEPTSSQTASNGLRDMPRPFVMLPPLGSRNEYRPGATFGLEATLMGSAMHLLPYWVATIEHMGQQGIGRARGKFRLIGIEAVDLLGNVRPAYDPQSRQVTAVDSAISTRDIAEVASRLCEQPVYGVQLHIATYLRIKANGELQDRLPLPLLVRALLRRIDILSKFYGSGPVDWPYEDIFSAAEDSESMLGDSHWEDWSRVSFRQKSRMKLGGVTGDLVYRGASIGRLLPLLIAGQLLHCGKNTTFGLGAYRIVRLLREG